MEALRVFGWEAFSARHSASCFSFLNSGKGALSAAKALLVISARSAKEVMLVFTWIVCRLVCVLSFMGEGEAPSEQ